MALAILAYIPIVTAHLVIVPFVYLYFYTSDFIGGEYPTDMHLSVQENASEIVDSIVNSSIFGSFESFAPFPIIILALLTTYALCSAGNYYESIMKVIDGCYVLFAKMLFPLLKEKLVIISYLQAPQIISLAIYSETLFGGILSMTNAAGDIVTVAVAEKRALKQKQQN